MFGRKKREYYGTALSIVQNYFQIETDYSVNPNFPGYFVYMDILSEAYHIRKATVEEAAAILVLGYWGGLVEARFGSISELNTMKNRLLEFIRSSAAANKFNHERAATFISRIQNHATQNGLL